MKLAIFTGPSGGHFYPALAFAEAFQESHPDARLLFVTGERGRFLAEKAKGRFKGQFEFLADFPFPRPRQPDFIIRALPFLLKLAQAFAKSKKILDDFKPDLSVGFGSYVAFPALWVSRRKKIPTLIHEQNRKMGKANAWLARLSDKIALSFEEGSGIVTGLPLRSSLVERSLRTGRAEPSLFGPGRFRILVVGGSQGSQSLNRLWKETVECFSDEEKKGLAVIHITGGDDFETFKAMYPKKGIEALVFAYHERMEELYSEADLAITRAGAGTLFELALFGLPAIVFPYPHAEGHQELNARYFEERGGVILRREGEGAPVRLKKEILELINPQSLRNRMSAHLRGLARPDAARRLVEVAEGFL